MLIVATSKGGLVSKEQDTGSTEDDSNSVDVPQVKRPGRGKYMLLLGLAVYCGAIWYFGWQDIQGQVLGTDIVKVVAAAGIIFSRTWMRVLKWRYALGPQQHAAGLFSCRKLAEISPPDASASSRPW